MTPSSIISYLKTNFEFNIETEFKKWNELKENICRRNVITHNMGKIDEQYIDCADAKKDLEFKNIGREIKHDLEYVKISNENVGRYMVFIFKRISNYYGLKDIKQVVHDLAEDHFPDVNSNLLKDI